MYFHDVIDCGGKLLGDYPSKRWPRRVGQPQRSEFPSDLPHTDPFSGFRRGAHATYRKGLVACAIAGGVVRSAACDVDLVGIGVVGISTTEPQRSVRSESGCCLRDFGRAGRNRHLCSAPAEGIELRRTRGVRDWRILRQLATDGKLSPGGFIHANDC